MQGEPLDYCLILVPPFLFFWGKCPPTWGLYNNTVVHERKKDSTSWWQLVHELLYEGQSICNILIEHFSRVFFGQVLEDLFFKMVISL
jgi:hypothetical protein